MAHMRPAALIFCLPLTAAPVFTDPPKIVPNPNPAAPLAAVLTFKTGKPVRTAIEISDGANRWNLEFPAERVPEKGLPIVGMRPARKHQLRLTIRDGKSKATQTLEYTTPPLPTNPSEFPPLKITVRKPARMEPGYTLFSPRRNRAGDLRFGAGYGMLLAIDDAGEVVWYYRANSRISDLQRLRNGNIAYITQDYRVTEIDMLGNVVRQWYASRRPQGPFAGAAPVDTTTFHHEVDELPNGNLVALGSEVRTLDNYFTSETDAAAPRKTQKVMGDEVVEFDAAGKVLWRWNAFEHMDPYRIGYETFSKYWDRRGFPGVVDWSHANGLLYDPHDDSLLVCFRYQAAVLKIDRKTKEVKWVLGDPAGWTGNLAGKTMKIEGDARWFYHQHAPQPTPRGTLLIFDNGNYQRRPFTPALPLHETYSRAVEYSIDEKARTVRQRWTSETGADPVVSTAMGDVDWMPKTGNILVHYGALLPNGKLKEIAWENMQQLATWSRIREYTHTTPAEIVWEAVIGDPTGKDDVTWILFGGDRIRSLLP